jgi:Calx-beta domain
MTSIHSIRLRRLAAVAVMTLSVAAPGLARTASAAPPDIFTPIPLRTVTLNSPTVTEPASGSVSAGVVITLHSGPLTPGEQVTVHYYTEDGTALAGTDYVPIIDNVVTFLAGGPTVLAAPVLVNHDSDDTEGRETFTVHATGVGFPATGTVTILPPGGGGDDDHHCDHTQQVIVCI